MATIVTDLHCDLTQNVKPQFLHGNLFSQDNAANTINVHVFNDGEPATLGGSISANVIRSDGATVAVSGAIDGNKAYIILPQACYAVHGVIKIIVKNTENTTVTTIAAVVANVYASSTDTVVDPGTIIPSVAALIAQIEAAVDSIPVDYSGLLLTLAKDYTQKPYIVGEYAWQGGVLKRCIVPITTAETYTAAHWTNAVLGDDVTNLKSAIEAFEKTGTSDNFEVTGGIVVTDGTTASGSTRLTTKTAFTKQVYQGAKAINGYKFAVFAWDGDTYIGSYRSGTFAKTSGSASLEEFDFAAFPSSYKFKIAGRRSDSGTIALSEKTNFIFTMNIIQIDKTLSVEGAAADADAVGDIIWKTKDHSTDTPHLLTFHSLSGIDSYDAKTMPVDTWVYGTYGKLKTTFDDMTNVDLTSLECTDNGTYIRIEKHATTNAGNIFYLDCIFAWPFRRLIIVYNDADGYRQISTDKDLVREFAPADSKAVGNALDTLIYGGRTKSTLTSLPFCWLNTGSMQTLDFRDMPMNTFAWVTYSKIKTGLSDTNMPENDWSDSDIVAVYKRDTRKGASSPNSVVTFYNFTKTRKIEMLYYAGASSNKYRWILTGITNNNTFNYTYNQYANEYNISASPEITTDTNNYLQPSGDTTDMASAIETMLTQTGVCNLAPGDFYVSGIDMPDNTMIRGSGASTRIYLLDSVTDGYAIKMGTRCIVEDCRIMGATTQYTPTSTIGTRNGIVWQGTATSQSATSSKPARGTISNCYISNFSGGGIYCQGTGTNINNNLNVVNVFIHYCTVGIYIPLLSEFNKFTNVDCFGCYWGSINNGGNNVFANCGFSKNIIGVMIDNEYGQSTNSAHGTYTGCVFNHSGANNDGVAIKLLGITAREIFTGCQIFYGSVVIDNCKGIVMNACNFGNSIPITITDGNTVLFNGCIFRNAPTITKTNNADTHFVACYTNDGDTVGT